MYKDFEDSYLIEIDKKIRGSYQEKYSGLGKRLACLLVMIECFKDEDIPDGVCNFLDEAIRNIEKIFELIKEQDTDDKKTSTKVISSLFSPISSSKELYFKVFAPGGPLPQFLVDLKNDEVATYYDEVSKEDLQLIKINDKLYKRVVE